MPHRSRVAVAVLLCVALVATLTASIAGAAPPPAHVPPVEAEVVDPFRPPAKPFGPGNRGLLYGTGPDTPVQATADGVVVFAGFVAGTRHVAVRHADGLRTSYSYLDRIDVVVGQRVRQGDVLGTTVGQLHLGARIGDSYLDPASLFGTGPPQVHLVPFDEPLGFGAGRERSAVRQIIGGLGGAVGSLGGLAEHAVDRVLSSSGATVDWLRDSGGQLLRTAAHYLEPMELRMVRRGVNAWLAAKAIADRECTKGSVSVTPPSERRVAVLVAGLGSTSEHGAIDDVDTDSLGYDEGDVLRFSYAGGRTPSSGAALAQIEASSYGAAGTQVDLRESGSRLADLVEDAAAAAPGTTIDLYAHSQGGLVTRLALAELEERHGAAWVARLGLVATLGTPHGGADLATAVHAVGSTSLGSLVFDAAQIGLRLELDDDAPSVTQMGETSAVIGELAATPLPAGVDAVSIAARGDLVVPVPRTSAPGATQVVVPVDGLRAHDALPGSAAAQRELALALAGAPPGCSSFLGALTGQAMGEGISLAQDGAGALAWIGSTLVGGSPFGG